MIVETLRRPWRLSLVLAALFATSSLACAFAEDVVVKRHVTVRAAPARQAEVMIFPEVGSSLALLDAGAKTHGYYHVVLADGRQGYVYHTFVRRSEGAGALVASAAAPGDRIAVHYINVDQGAAALLEFPCGAVLVDAGGRGDQAAQHLIAYLDAFFARRPDLNKQLAGVFVTHTHIDHNSNLKAVAQRFGIKGYVHNGLFNGSGRAAARWMAGFPPNTPAFAAAATPPIQVRAVAQSEVVAAGSQGLTDSVIDPVACPRVDPSIRVLSARYESDPGWDGDEFENGNNHSLVIRVDYGAASFLFTGDLEEPAIETMVERYGAGRQLDVDVYQAGHHGSYNGTTASLLRAMSPKVAVISAGDPGVRELWTAYAYGHPRRNLVTALDQGVSAKRAPKDVQVADKVKGFSSYRVTGAVYSTSWDHDVTISSSADGVLKVEPGR